MSRISSDVVGCMYDGMAPRSMPSSSAASAAAALVLPLPLPLRGLELPLRDPARFSRPASLLPILLLKLPSRPAISMMLLRRFRKRLRCGVVVVVVAGAASAVAPPALDSR